MDEVGQIDFPARTVDQYLEGFTSNLRVDLIRQVKFRVVIDYAYGTSCLALPSILSKLGCEVVSLNAYIDADRSREQLMESGRALNQLVSIVTTLKADLGIYFDPTGERLTLVDDRGKIIAGARLLALFTLLVFRQTKEALVAVPVVAPSVIEELAKKSGGKVIWTRTDSRTLTYTATLGEARFAMAGGIRGDFVFPGFSPGFDALFAFARLLEMIAREGKPLSTLEEWIPPFCLESFSVDCSWQAKGRVMRMLFEEVGDRKVELVDGLKVWDEGGWVLILPDRSEPLLEVWVYAEKPEQLEQLKTTYRAVVEKVSLLAAEAPAARPLRTREATTTPQAMAEDRAFHFWVPGRYLGVRARSLKEFVDVLHYIDPISLRYHFDRGDFANWLGQELKEPDLAKEIRALRTASNDGEGLRLALLGVLSSDKEAQSV
jgi:mannose-1-phosphate guanylyltransferase/phosphomannomutase